MTTMSAQDIIIIIFIYCNCVVTR